VPDDGKVRTNTVAMDGVVVAPGALKHTPAGIAACDLRLKHESQQDEAGRPRRVALEIPAVGFGEVAKRLSQLEAGTAIEAKGFLAAKSMTHTQTVLHINEFNLIDTTR
jgi:primosomal replication protein N